MNTEEVLISLSEKVLECKTQAEAFGVIIQAYHKGYYDGAGYAIDKAVMEVKQFKEQTKEVLDGNNTKEMALHRREGLSTVNSDILTIPITWEEEEE